MSRKCRSGEEIAELGFAHPQRNDPKMNLSATSIRRIAIISNQTLIARLFVHVRRLLLLPVMIIDAAWVVVVHRSSSF